MQRWTRVGAILTLLLTLVSLQAEETSQSLQLRTAGYYELVDWCRSLGLSDTGGVPELRHRLAEHLNLALSPEDSALSGKTLTIDTAQQAGVMTVDSPGSGREIHLQGDLRVTLTDNEKNVTHVIEAGELWYDQDSGEMTARGDVVYTMIREASKETFRGESLTFRMSDSQGVFYGGSSERSRNVVSRELVFRYEGKAIRRGGSDVVVLDKGSITSSLNDDPYYRIQAQKIWVLRPGEWGLQDAVLYLGRVPVFWFPFYFQAADDLFFNPVVSFTDAQNRRGTSLQTTTYLWGRKTRESSPLSFLQMEDSSTKDTGKVPRGLYLSRGVPSPSGVPEDWSLKILADVYSHLGFLAGIDGNLPGNPISKTLQFTAGVGFTRTVSSDGVTFSLNPFNALLQQDDQNRWNGSWLGDQRLPFRWAGSLAAGDSWWSLSLEYFSDPLIWGDLTGGRAENSSLLALVGLEPPKKTSTVGARNTLTWKGSLTLPSNPLGASGSLQGTLAWDAKSTTPAKSAEDPESQFFVPSQLVFPNLSGQWSGDLLKLKAPEGPRRADEDGDFPDFVPLGTGPSPDSPAEPESESESVAESPEWLRPALLSALPVPPPPATWGNSLSWSLTPSARNELRFDNSAVTSSPTFHGNVLNSRWNAAWDARATFSSTLSDGGLAFSDALSLHQQAQKVWYFSPTATPATIAAAGLLDAQQTWSLLNQTVSATWKPWLAISPLKDSSVAYNLATTLWQDKSGTTLWFDGTPSTVTAHNGTAQLVWLLPNAFVPLKLSLSGQTNLPPTATNTSFGWGAEAGTTAWKISNKTSFRTTGADWKPDPWDWTLDFTPSSDFAAHQTFSADLVKGVPSSATTRVTWSGWAFQFRAQQTVPYSFDSANRRWVASGGQGFYPQEANLGYNLNVPLMVSWENRQTLKGNLNITWPINLQQFTQMPLNLNYSITYKLHRFLDLQVSETITHKALYRYLPFLVDALGPGTVSWINPLTDLWDSLSFWDDAARRRGGFKMGSLSVGLVHYLDDWQLKLDYTGSPQLTGTVTQQYQWTGTLSLQVQWYPVPELKTQMLWDKTGKLTLPKS